METNPIVVQAKAEENQAGGSKQKAANKPGGSYAERLDRVTKELDKVLTEFEHASGEKEKLSPVAEEEEDEGEGNAFDKSVWDQESPDNFSSDSDDDGEPSGAKSPVV